jgi:hypothetical protein
MTAFEATIRRDVSGNITISGEHKSFLGEFQRLPESALRYTNLDSGLCDRALRLAKHFDCRTSIRDLGLSENIWTIWHTVPLFPKPLLIFMRGNQVPILLPFDQSCCLDMAQIRMRLSLVLSKNRTVLKRITSARLFERATGDPDGPAE